MLRRALRSAASHPQTPRPSRSGSDRRRRRERATPPAPLVPAALGFSLGVAGADRHGAVQGAEAEIVLIGMLFTAAVALWRWRSFARIPSFAAFVLASTAAGAGFVRMQYELRVPTDHVARIAAETPLLCRVRGVVMTEPRVAPPERRNPYYQQPLVARTTFLLSLEALEARAGWTPRRGVLRVSALGEALALQVGSRVEIAGSLATPPQPHNPREADWARWSWLQGVDAALWVEDPDNLHVTAPAASTDWRARLRLAVRRMLHEPAALVAGDDETRLLDTMVLGLRTAADRQMNETFANAGGAHFLAVSGFHVGVLALCVWWLSRRALRIPEALSGLLVLSVILAYAFLAETNAPILRAAIAAVILLAARRLRRPLSPLNWLAVAALAILVINPRELFRPGFQLSFVVTAALVTLVPLLHRRWIPAAHDSDHWPVVLWGKLWRRAAGLALVCVVAWLAAAPLGMFHFARLTPWGALGALLMSPLVVAIIWLSFLQLVAGAWLPGLDVPIRGALSGSVSALLELAEGLAALPGAALDVGRPTAWLLVLTYGLPLAIFLWPRSRRRRRSNTRRVDAPAWPLRRRNLRWAAAGVLALAWLGWMLRPLPLPRGAIGLYVLDVGNGSANLLVDASRTGHVVDAGSQRNMDVARTVEFALDEWRVRRVASVVISHSNLDHYSAVAPLLARHPQAALFVNPFYEAVAAENGYLSLPEDLRAAGWTGAPQPLAAGAALDFGGHAVEVLWPPADATIRSTNDQSLVLRIHANRRTILIPGDIERDALEALLVQVDAQSLDLTADILIAPHHGAVIDPFTELFLEAVQPEVVLVSTQREQVRLAPLVHRVMGPRCAVYMTRTHGALALTIDPAGVIRVELPFSARAPDE